MLGRSLMRCSICMRRELCIGIWNLRIFCWKVIRSSYAISVSPRKWVPQLIFWDRSRELLSTSHPKYFCQDPTLIKLMFGRLALFFTSWQRGERHSMRLRFSSCSLKFFMRWLNIRMESIWLWGIWLMGCWAKVRGGGSIGSKSRIINFLLNFLSCLLNLSLLRKSKLRSRGRSLNGMLKSNAHTYKKYQHNSKIRRFWLRISDMTKISAWG